VSELEEALSDAARHVVYDSSADIPHDVYDLLSRLVGDVQALKEATSRTVATDAGMSRVEALAAAREHVEAMSTNSRGFQDGVKLADKVQAVDRFARFLMGESE
jgi:hypothetical protein